MALMQPGMLYATQLIEYEKTFEEVTMLKQIGKNLEKTFMAVAFAEAGEHETALEIIREKDIPVSEKQSPGLDRTTMQVQVAGLKK